MKDAEQKPISDADMAMLMSRLGEIMDRYGLREDDGTPVPFMTIFAGKGFSVVVGNANENDALRRLRAYVKQKNELN